MNNKFDFIVVGVGSMGAATTYALARMGHTVLGIDQYNPPHDLGSHAGQSRIIRKAYFEHPDYVPLLERSYELWKEFEKTTGKKFYYETGIVYFGEAKYPTMEGVRKSAELYNVPITVSTSSGSRLDYPAFNIPPTFQTLFEPEAGFVRPEFAIEAYLQEAKRLGAAIHTNEKVIEWKLEANGVKVVTDGNTYEADKLILTAGSWMQSLVATLKTKLKVTRQTLAWISPKKPEAFALGEFPCWFIEDPQLGMFYGFPLLPFEKFGGPIGLKIASHRPGQIVDPDDVPRVVTERDTHDLKFILSHYLPEAGDEIISLKTCLYTYSPDENFIIDILNNSDGRVIVAAGFSGHGFKFVPVVGEILADLATKRRTSLPINFLSLYRPGL